MEDRACSDTPATERLPDADARLLEQIHAGDAEASRRFIREHYPAIYRYLLYLTRRPEQAEDLTQETFLQAWRHLGTFIARASLRAWLHRIARREFLQALRRQRAQTSLEEIAEAAEPQASAWMEAVELHEVIDRLPLPQREVVLLHYLEGYTSTEIARIVGAPVGTVCDRLARAREHLRQELGEDDLTYLNEPLAPMRQWAWLPLDQMYALETRLARGGEAKEDPMERREFLRQAAAGAVGLALSEPGKEVVDGRLTQKVTLAFKGTALADLCEHLRQETGVHLSAGASVADEKVTLFCKQMPLRDVMRQLSRPFGYAWVRSANHSSGGAPSKYRYELVQDLRSQLLEEELRNRDRNAAILALDREVARYRPYLGLTPDEALARSKTATPNEKRLLENFAGYGWAAIQMYTRLSAQDLATLRAGQALTFRVGPRPGERALPPEVARGALQPFRDWYLTRRDEGWALVLDKEIPGALLVPAVPEAHPLVTLRIDQDELGQMALLGYVEYFTLQKDGREFDSGGVVRQCAVGRSPAATDPHSRDTSGESTRDAALRTRITIQPQGSCVPAPGLGTDEASIREAKVTTADVLEALHLATGFNIVADHYTRLYKPGAVSVRDGSFCDALNQLSDTMRLRWRKEAGSRDTTGAPAKRTDPVGGGWLQFRSASYYDDRLKEVPNRLLARWQALRQQQGFLTLDALVEIAQLPDAQLDAKEMAEGARDCFGLAEWDLARNKWLRPHLRFLAGFTPAQRQEAQSASGLPFAQMPLGQQQQFLSLALGPKAPPLQSLEELSGAVLRVEYTQPGWFRWGEAPGSYTHWMVPLGPGRRVPRPQVRERTHEAAVQAVRRVDPQIREALLQRVRSGFARLAVAAQPEATLRAVEEQQISPTTLDLVFAYVPGPTSGRPIFVRTPNATYNAWP